MIQRGVVLSRDDIGARYLVLFENADFGYEFCPDTEVATHGGPEMLPVAGAQRYLASSLCPQDEHTAALLPFASRQGTHAGKC